jgi:hypothetical protein
MSAAPELHEESFPLQLASELLERTLDAVALGKLDFRHGGAPREGLRRGARRSECHDIATIQKWAGANASPCLITLWTGCASAPV